jgi:hypothetical protein
MSAWDLSWLIAFPTLLIALPMVPCITGLLFELLMGKARGGLKAAIHQ